MGATLSFGESNYGSQVAINHGQIINQVYQPNLDDKLRVVHGAAFDSYVDQHEDECFPGTRTDILRQIKDWASSPQGRCIFWLNGMAGTGKSTISRTIAQAFRMEGQLGASFFFQRGEGDRGNATRFFTTVANQLMAHIPELRPLIQKVLQNDPNISTKSLSEQFKQLILQPLGEIAQTVPQVQRVVVVVDALDECAPEQDVRMLLHLLPQIKKSPVIQIRIFVTSRPELPIRLGFRKISQVEYQDIILHNIPRPVIEHDMSIFIHHKLMTIREEHDLPSLWPDQKSIRALIQMAVPLFIFATTICRFIADHNWDPEERLNKVLEYQNLSLSSKLDGTYLPILDQLLIDVDGMTEKQELISDFQRIIGAIILLFEPLSLEALAKMLDIPESKICVRLKSLHSVLHIPENKTSPVRMLHLSFRDFLVDSNACDKTPFYVDENQTHQQLTTRCLAVCRSMRKNMCALSSDGIRRVDICPKAINHYLSPELQYACRYWAYHLIEIKDVDSMIDEALIFLQKHFLHWVEGMSLLGLISEVLGSLDHLQSAIPDHKHSGMSAFLQDAKRFIRKNRQIADEAPLQLYCAGLIFAPQKSIIRKEFESELPNWIYQVPEINKNWSAELQALESQSNSVHWVANSVHSVVSSVHSVALSPDGRILASSSGDQTVRLWDTATGGLQQTLEGHRVYLSHDEIVRLWDTATGALQQTLEGHSNTVDLVANSLHSVTFSPDGRILASGANDKTVRLWNTVTGGLQQTLEGHSGSVYSVAFSPDGRLLASGSRDLTVRLWNTATGGLQQTLEGHFELVSSVTFSPNGRLLASGSWDHIVQLWDTAIGGLQYTLKGHSGPVSSVAFSPDGRLLASGSYDSTVRLWDSTISGLQQTLEGHSDPVQSVAFSPNGQLLASGSWDYIVRLWDPATGDLQQTLEGHSDTVHLVAFSPDGGLLASSSWDHTIRLWNIATGGLQQTLKGHSTIISIAFSPDGRLLASSSGDKILRLWDTATGALQQTLKGHSSIVFSVAFSPDGRLLASGSSDETVRLWDTAIGGLQQTLEGHSSIVFSVAFSPDCRLLASGSSDKTVRLWDIPTGNLQATLDTEGTVTKLKFSRDGSNLITNLGTFGFQSRHIKHAANAFFKTPAISIEQGQWINMNGKNILWLHPEFRPSCSAIHGDSIALGHDSGRISFLRFRL
ncbi:WD domain protein [Penicillium canariense]|uniref:WD domain protein n=1 Tax=Penicillium canariense TaxID=189055 RepID=A0A9W9LJA5_9EURO|nr:WD domain protein [Penicillium canariense]KAJ5159574.1 WD domain protein [Penicillium canariense]